MMYHDLLLPKMVVKARGKVDQVVWRRLTVRLVGQNGAVSGRQANSHSFWLLQWKSPKLNVLKLG